MSDLAEGTGGQVIPAEQEALGAVFSAQADALAQQLLVTFDRPEDAADEVNLGVTVDAGGTSYTDSAFVSHRRGRVRPRTSCRRASPSSAPPACSLGALALALGLAGLLAVVIAGPEQVVGRPPPRRLLRREGAGGKRKSDSDAPTSRARPSPSPTRWSRPTSRPASPSAWRVPGRRSPRPSGCCCTRASPSARPSSASS